jgi:alpha-methylacyl-CoA racemase
MGALSGLRVIEMVGLGPGPFAAMMLADHGAEVLRLHPLRGAAEVPVVNSRFDVLARGRASVAMDLKAPGAAAAVQEMLAGADALIEGFRPGVMERLGLGPEAALARNPRLVYGRMTGWGQTGPLAARAGHDINYLALTGVLGALGREGEPPPVPLNLVADFGGGGMLMAFGLLAGILQVRAGGPGQVVDAAMTEGAGLLAGMMRGMRAAGAWSDERGANLLDGGAWFYSTYACACGGFVAVGAIEAKFRAALLAGLGLDPAAFTGPDDPARWPAQKARIAGAFAGRSRADWEAVFADTDACVTPVLGWAEAEAHPQAHARDSFLAVGGVTQPAPVPRFSATPADHPAPPMAPAADPATLLAAWGLAPARIAALRAAGAIAAAQAEGRGR